MWLCGIEREGDELIMPNTNGIIIDSQEIVNIIQRDFNRVINGTNSGRALGMSSFAVEEVLSEPKINVFRKFYNWITK
jgi:hypothetical protein